MNNVLEQYGVSARVVRSLREKNADKSTDEKSPDDSNGLLEKKEKIPYSGNELMDANSANNNTEDLQNNLKVIEEDSELGLMTSGSGRSSFTEGTTRENRKRGSSISLGLFTR